MTAIFALTTRGLESVCAREMERFGLAVGEMGYRRVHAQARGDLRPLLALSTADDLFLEVSRWSTIGHTRSALDTLRELGGQLDLYSALAVCAQLRPIDRRPIFAVTANFVGRRNYSSDEIKAALAAGIQASHGWSYSEDDGAAALNVRLFIEHAQALVGVRLGATPLHRRSYKQEQRPGSLKPTVAAALLEMLALRPGETFLDPCCGAGTILVEAARRGGLAQGGDNDAGAVAAALSNAENAGVSIAVERWDARCLPLPDGSVGCIAANLPWNRQVVIDADETLFYAQLCAEMERVLAPGGRVALLTNRPELLRFQRLACREQIEISLFGQRPVITVYGENEETSYDTPGSQTNVYTGGVSYR
ncbi:MAG: methyltransferase domain-containing protein [Chloroflexi bacterium]|nr:methyltransferase domain-containing protein [Chloroflexota bacterium]